MYNTRKERIVATIEARMTSSRLPGKVLLPIAGIPALEMLIKRLQQSKYLDMVCVATTTNTADEPIVTLAQKLGVGIFRGSESDVLGRVLGAAESMNADMIVEITGDCPFVDPVVVDKCVDEFFRRGVDYASNCITSSYPAGFEVQVFPTAVLSEVDTLTQDPIDRTHVSYYIYMHPGKYRCYNMEADSECSGPGFRMTLDEVADHKVLCVVADALLPQNPFFSVKEVVSFLREHPEVVAINQHVQQKTPENL